MKTTTKSVIILLIVINLSMFANAGNVFPPSDSNKSIPTFAVSMVPMYTLQNAFRVDFEVKIAKNQWILFGPQYFVAQNKDMLFLNNGEKTDLEGFGIDIYHKIILKSEESISGPYAAYGIRYNSLNFKYQAWNTGGSMVDKNVTNSRYGFNVIFGYQSTFNNKLLLDLYTGCGVQVSNLSGDDGSLSDFGSSPFNFLNYNYSGPRFILGFRVGLFLN